MEICFIIDEENAMCQKFEIIFFSINDVCKFLNGES